MPRDSQDGLDWRYDLFETVPVWTRQPSISAIENVSRQLLKVPSGDLCRISFYASGAFNKLYRVECADRSLIMRVSLPVYPRCKIQGEVATLTWLQYNTTAPVPKVVAFDDCNDNEIGFEWILMEFMPGFEAYQKWRAMSMEQKTVFAKRIADIQAELFRPVKLDRAFKGIGTLQTNSNGPRIEKSAALSPGPLVTHEFFLGKRLSYDVPRGPFRSSYAWLEAQLKIIVLEQLAAIKKAEDEDDKEDAEEILLLARRLLSLLPKVFQISGEEDEEPTILWHDDLNLRNILVDDRGEITAIVDWECVSAMPAWVTTNMPKFLQGENRTEEPIRENYMDETPEDRDESDRDNEGKNPLYWGHLMEYEMTQLREVYGTRLRQSCPDWPLRHSHTKIDFYEAVIQCNAGVFVRKVNKWINEIESGNMIRWADI
ncbi:phosphotransferase enzyme family-domain-containing protein [Nemania abortiva]|nr:phosphotransferase enzyme family-domain-containing protein [Nemania abortiva]